MQLRTATNAFFKIKNYKTAASFARRLLEQGPPPQVAQQVRKILAVCEKNPVDEVKLDYDELNPFTPCAISHKPLYKGTASVKCAYCAAVYQTQYKGQLCRVCQLSEVVFRILVWYSPHALLTHSIPRCTTYRLGKSAWGSTSAPPS